MGTSSRFIGHTSTDIAPGTCEQFVNRRQELRISPKFDKISISAVLRPTGGTSMGRFSDYLLISDFDLTLTGHDDRVPQANVDALKAWIAEGGAFSVATGRSLMMAWRRVRDIPRNARLITFNGAFCSEPTTGETVFSFPMPESYKELLAPILAERPDLSVELQGL